MSQVVSRCLKSHKSLRKFSSQISLQIEAVNNFDIPKNGFLFDYGTVDAKTLRNLINKLKLEKLVSNDIKVVTLELEIFILNVKKFCTGCDFNIVNISKSFNKPELIEDSSKIVKVIDEIVEKLKNSTEDIIELGSYSYLCPTLFGYLINYPVLYYCDSEENNLSNQELKVFQVTSSNHVLLSFSVPLIIYNESPKIQNDIKIFLDKFNESYNIKIFNTTQCNIIL
jgi:hypothetical protein